MLIKVLLGAGPRALGAGGVLDRCGSWSLGVHCLDEGMSKEAITNQLGEAG